MLYELRTYTFHQGKLPQYLEIARTVGRPARGQNYGINCGYWTSEFGSLNQIWHLWQYESYEQRAQLRDALSKNEAWTKNYVPNIRPLIARQDIRFLNPVYGVTPPAKEGNFFELRMYRFNPGMAGPWAQAFKGIMPVREKYSKNVGIWTGEAPQPNEVLHMWAYASFEERTRARTELFKDPDWLAFVAKGAGAIVEMNNVMLIPTDYSPMK
jgi:NIPSNAP